ncbi:hypothetical protein CH252_19145 [Rhodococcus sp. 06-1477-1B]|nr:hypothetical protein CH252_19145 [Rhodococcus sp. 06-1477-1B]
MSIIDQFLFPHEVLVEDRTGGGAGGTGHIPPQRVKAEVDDEQSLARDAQGEEVISSTTVTVPLDTRIRVGGFVTVWPDDAYRRRRAEVLFAAPVVNTKPLPSHTVLRLK